MNSWDAEWNSLGPWEGEDCGSERTVKSAERTLALFELFSLRQEPLTIGQMSRLLGIPQPSVTMLARNLVRLGYLEQNREQRTYLPTVRVMLLGTWVHKRLQIDNDIEHHLDELLRECDETVLLGLQNRLYCQYICALKPDQPNRLEIQSGMLRPLPRTAIGRMLLSQKSDHEISLFLRRCNAEFPEHLRVNAAEFMEEMHIVRSQGYAQTNGDMTAGHSVIAVPVATPIGTIPMAVGVGGATDRIQARKDTILRALRKIGDRLSADESAALSHSIAA